MHLKLILVLALMGCCTAFSGQNKDKTTVNYQDGTLEITTPNGKRITIHKEQGSGGHRQVDVQVSGPYMPTKSIQISGDQHQQTKEVTIGQHQQSNKTYAEQETILTQLFSEYHNKTDEKSYQDFLNKVQKFVDEGKIDPSVFRFFKSLDEQEGSQIYYPGSQVNEKTPGFHYRYSHTLQRRQYPEYNRQYSGYYGNQYPGYYSKQYSGYYGNQYPEYYNKQQYGSQRPGYYSQQHYGTQQSGYYNQRYPEHQGYNDQQDQYSGNYPGYYRSQYYPYGQQSTQQGRFYDVINQQPYGQTQTPYQRNYYNPSQYRRYHNQEPYGAQYNEEPYYEEHYYTQKPVREQYYQGPYNQRYYGNQYQSSYERPQYPWYQSQGRSYPKYEYPSEKREAYKQPIYGEVRDYQQEGQYYNERYPQRQYGGAQERYNAEDKPTAFVSGKTGYQRQETAKTHQY